MSFTTLVLLIDNTKTLQDYALYLTNECLAGVQDRTAYRNLADSLRVWIEDAVDNYADDVKINRDKEGFFYYLLEGLVVNISENTWLELAQHYGQKWLELDGQDYKDNWAVKNPLV